MGYRAEVDRSTAAQAAAQQAQSSAKQIRHALKTAEENLRHREGETRALAELLKHAQRSSAELKTEVEQRSLALEANKSSLEQQLAESHGRIQRIESEAQKTTF